MSQRGTVIAGTARVNVYVTVNDKVNHDGDGGPDDALLLYRDGING